MYRIITNLIGLDIGLWFGILTTCGMSSNESGVLVKLILNMKSIALKRDFSGLGQN